MAASATVGAIGKALAGAQGEMKGATKDSANPFFKSKYADLASVWDACREALSKNGLAVVQAPKADGAKVSVTTILIHESGEWVSEELTAQAKDDSPQSVGSIITYLRRYGLSSFVGVAPEDDDAESAQPRGHYVAPVVDKAGDAKLARIKVLSKMHGEHFKAFSQKVLKRDVKAITDFTLEDIALLEGGDLP